MKATTQGALIFVSSIIGLRSITHLIVALSFNQIQTNPRDVHSLEVDVT